MNTLYMNAVFKANKNGLHLSLCVKTNGPLVTALVLFCFGAAPLSKIAQLQSPQVHSFNQSLSWPYIFVYYLFFPIYIIGFLKDENRYC